MIFASKYKRLRIHVLHEKRKFLGQNQFGDVQWEIEVPHFAAEFAPTVDGGPSMLSRDRLAAYKYFAPNGNLFAGSASHEQGYLGGEAYDASDEKWQLGVFDTNDPRCVPDDLAEWRPLIEKRLCQIGEDQRWVDFVKIGVAVLDPPWPAYESAHHNEIAKLTRQFGLKPADVLAYEKAREKPRPTVIEQLEALDAEQTRERADAAALEVTI